MKSLASLLKKDFFKKNHRKKTEVDDKTIFFIFKKIIREEFGAIGSEKFIPDKFSNKTVFIKSTSPAWSAEMWMNEKRIAAKINQELGEELVEEIKIK